MKHKIKNAKSEEPKDAESILHPLQLKQMINKSIAKLISENCYPENILNELGSYTFNMDEVLYIYEYCKPVINAYNGNGEKFFPTFYKHVFIKERAFRGLSQHSCSVIGLELANHVLAHLNQANTVASQSEQHNTTSLTTKEKACIAYLSGYVFGKFYRRIRSSKQWNSAMSQQYLSLLTAGKETDESAHLNEINSLISAKNRGGLWIVSSDVYQMFVVVETYFRKESSNTSKKISCTDMATELLKNNYILCRFSKLCSLSEQKVDKETSLNLLEQLIALYIRVRIFSYAKDQMQRHKIKSKKTKARSLRTEIKKKSNSLDKGK